MNLRDNRACELNNIKIDSHGWAKRVFYALVLVAVGFGGFFTPQYAQAQSCSGNEVFWVNWQSVIVEDGLTKYVGTIDVTRPNGDEVAIEVKFSGPNGVHLFQDGETGDTTDYFESQGVNPRDPTLSPYTSADVCNVPPPAEMIALRYQQKNTLEFSQQVGNPYFAYVSLNGNGYAFDQNFDVLSYGDAADGNDCGYFGCGTSYKEVAVVNGTTEYQLLGTGEPHGTLRFIGAFNVVNWRSLSNEFWNGFTLGIAGLAEDVPTDSDEDGLPDNEDNCPATANPGQLDTDEDGKGDACDALNCVGDDSTGDSDGDGICESDDACPNDAGNDADGDGVCGDVDLCSGDDATGDADADGLCNDSDACLGDNATGDVDSDGTCNDLDQCSGDDLSGDSDNDGICDSDDQCVGDDATSDTDSDGVCDDLDLCLGDDSTGNSDADETCDGSDICPLDPLDDEDEDGVCGDVDACIGNDLLGDSDGDDICDDQDLCIGIDATGDQDGDGVCDDLDNCPSDANSGQSDVDADEIGDACEADTDADGVIDDDDNCPSDSNDDQSDADADELGDACDMDDDNDGVVDLEDNCPLYANTAQANFDNDEFGDVCDGDDDADGVLDDVDACLGTPLNAIFDENGCSGIQNIERTCGVPDDYGWRRRRYVSCVAHASKAAQRSGLIMRRQRARIIRRAAWSNWGYYRRSICRWR